ncbi:MULTISPECIES: cysteine/serine endopeptidase inhibitor [unclassified Streptomyces]|uniref:cysteine/serine endopeptidase inhibitor n=1 Tax=unclassified Streptomyces TaxID=2593676 RepID=UPI0033F08BA0
MRTFRGIGRAVSVLAAAVTGVALGTGPAAAVPIGQPLTGKMTYYNDKGYGACGTSIDPTAQDLVAVSPTWWTSANPNNDPLCSGVSVEVSYQGRTITVPVRDKCFSCDPNHIDLSESAFRKLVPPGTDMVPSVTWKFVNG